MKMSGNWTKWTAGLALLAVALAAGALGLVLNVAHGLEAGLAAGIAFGLADGAKVLIPLTAGIIGWTRQMKITAAVCVAVSLWSAVNVYMDGAGQAILAKQHVQMAYETQAKAIAEREGDVARLTALAAEEAARGGCGKSCRAINEQIETARRRLAEAREGHAEAKPAEASGLASVIAMMSGGNADEIARGIGAVKAALFLMLIEALVWLSVPAMALLNEAARSDTQNSGTVILDCANSQIACASKTTATATAMQTIAKAAALPPKAGTKAYYMRRLEREHPQLAEKIASGEMSVYAASIAAGLRKAPAKAAKWTKIDAYLTAANAL
jgi:hypothetical protein